MFNKQLKDEGSVEIPREVRENKPMVKKAANLIVSEPAKKNSLISAGITIKGEVSGSDNVDVYGSVEGNLNLGNNTVNIEQSANIHADVVGKSIRINGKVVGNIAANEKILVTHNGHVTGDIKAPKVELQDGSYFDGNISMSSKTKIIGSSDKK